MIHDDCVWETATKNINWITPHIQLLRKKITRTGLMIHLPDAQFYFTPKTLFY